MSDHIFSFEKLEAWKESRILAKEIYILTKGFPAEEKYGLCQQIRRSSISVCSNIAEGTSRSSAKDQAHFTTMAFGSLMELLNQIIIAFDLHYLTEKQLNFLRNLIQPLSIKLSNLKKSQLSRLNS